MIDLMERSADEGQKVITPALCEGLGHLCQMGLTADEAKERVCQLIDVMWGDEVEQRKQEQQARARADKQQEEAIRRANKLARQRWQRRQ